MGPLQGLVNYPFFSYLSGARGAVLRMSYVTGVEGGVFEALVVLVRYGPAKALEERRRAAAGAEERAGAGGRCRAEKGFR